MKFPTGGKVRKRKLIRCDSGTDSIVWMEEDAEHLPFCHLKAFQVTFFFGGACLESNVKVYFDLSFDRCRAVHSFRSV